MSRQFQGSLGPMQNLQAERQPASQNPHLDAWTSTKRAKRVPHSFAQRLGTVAGIGILLLFALAAAVRWL
jgi:hypothetical protein